MHAANRSSQLVVLAKYWEPGQVKTRLAATVGELAATRIHREFVRCIVWRLRATAYRRSIAVWPSHRQAAFRKLAPRSWRVLPQIPGDLGKKLDFLFRRHLSQPDSSLLAIGADSPDLPREILLQAFTKLETHCVVLGPATDGGYYLIGMKRHVPIFDGIEWGSGCVLEQTLERLKASGIEPALLETWPDVDNWDDLCALRDRLARPTTDRPLMRLAERIESALASVPQ